MSATDCDVAGSAYVAYIADYPKLTNQNFRVLVFELVL
jgi:hypothetical protein